MNLLTGMRRKVDELGEELRRIDRILTHPRWIVRGYMFLVQYRGRYYLLVNKKDLEIAVARLPSKTIKGIDLSMVMGIPVSNREEDVMKVIDGVFTWASKLQ